MLLMQNLMQTFDALAKKQAEIEDIIQAKDGHNIERTLEIAADALRLPDWMLTFLIYLVVKNAVWLYANFY